MIAAEVMNTNLQPPNPAHEGTKPRTSRTGRSGWSFLVSVLILAKCSVLSLCAADPDNFGQALFLVSLASDTNHPLVAKVLAEIPKFERQRDGLKFIQGRSDFSEHPAYQTKWLKLGLRALGLPDDYTVPRVADGYSALFWMDFKDNYVAGKDSNDRGNYPYLGWACDHFHGAKKSPIGNRDYPLTWEARASQAHYEGIQRMSNEYARLKLSAPHTWHAAEVFLYLLEQKAK